MFDYFINHIIYTLVHHFTLKNTKNNANFFIFMNVYIIGFFLHIKTQKQ